MPGLTKLISLTFMVLFVMTQAPHANADETQARYMELLEYEYGNRVFAHRSTHKAASMREGTELGAFYAAYHEMEIINQEIYTAMLPRLGVEIEPRWFDRARGWLGGFAGGIISSGPQFLIDMVVPYLKKLEELRELSDPKHRAFFDYVLAQEQIQLSAAQAAKENGWQAGADVFTRFVAEQSVPMRDSLAAD